MDNTFRCRARFAEVLNRLDVIAQAGLCPESMSVTSLNRSRSRCLSVLIGLELLGMKLDRLERLEWNQYFNREALLCTHVCWERIRVLFSHGSRTSSSNGTLRLWDTTMINIVCLNTLWGLLRLSILIF